jgi:Tfp pilus assembly protein PilP
VQQATNDSRRASATPSAGSKPAPGATAKPGAIPPVASAGEGRCGSGDWLPKPHRGPCAKPTAKPKVEIAAKATAPKPAAKGRIQRPPRFRRMPRQRMPARVAEAPKAPKPEEKKWAMSGKRDPFFSPVVQEPTGSGCSTGKKCLEIGQINLRGVVKSENGFIAVVTNSLNKAYFLRENDPVFNGYVVRITGDTVVFQETVQDKLGKPLTREVVKRIFTPAV